MRSFSSTPRRHRRMLGAVALMLVVLCVALAMLSFLPAPAQANSNESPATQNALQYILVAWNDLGMHCMNQWFQNLAVLPPFNTAWAQVIVRGNPPKIVTSGVTVSYSVQDNTKSVGKTDFWTYAPQLFGVTLPDNVGLAKKGLAGDMDAATDHFIATGIPLTPFLDSNPTVLYPYNLGNFVAKDGNGNTLATTTAVLPVSTEMHCDACHADGGDATEGITPTGRVETNILAKHDLLSGTTLMSQQPVLCAKCHADNALGAPGTAGVKNLSAAMHGLHADEMDDPSMVGGNVCYFCHPGPQTKCLRDVMYQHGLTCTDCHGTMIQVANPKRNPWVDVPRCGTCHKAQFAENTGKRYRDSVGHGGLYCEACHNSTHAIVPTIQYNDNIQTVTLQGYAGALGKCTVCHLTTPTGPGPHGLVIPAIPVLRAPAASARVRTARPTLTWKAVPHATIYNIQLRQDTPDGQLVSVARPSRPSYRTPTIRGNGTKYYWRVQACDLNLCGDWSAYRNFTVAAATALDGAPPNLSTSNPLALLTMRFFR